MIRRLTMLTARVDIIGHTSDTVDIQVIVFPTQPTDPEMDAVDVLDNSAPPISLIGALGRIPDCAPSLGVLTPFMVPGIPLTRLPIQVQATRCGRSEIINLGTFLREMSPRTGAVPCNNDISLPPSQLCLSAQGRVSDTRDAFMGECTNITDAKGKRDSAIAGAAVTGAAGIGAAAAAAAVVA